MTETNTTSESTTSNPTVEISWDDFVETCTSLSEGVFIATVQADGRPHVVWVMPGFSDGRVWIATFRSSQKAVNLRHGADVALHWPQRIDAIPFCRATARLVDDAAESARLWDSGILPYDLAQFFGVKENPELQFVELTPTQATLGSLDPSVPRRRWTPTA